MVEKWIEKLVTCVTGFFIQCTKLHYSLRTGGEQACLCIPHIYKVKHSLTYVIISDVCAVRILSFKDINRFS